MSLNNLIGFSFHSINVLGSSVTHTHTKLLKTIRKKINCFQYPIITVYTFIVSIFQKNREGVNTIWILATEREREKLERKNGEYTRHYDIQLHAITIKND